MKSRTDYLVLYLASIAAVTFFHFKNFILRYFEENNKYAELKCLFNKNVVKVFSEDQKKYYILLRKMILYNTYFMHIDMKKLIECYTRENYAIIQMEWKSLKISNRNIFLFYSTPYNLGIFLPIFLPIIFHVLNFIKKKSRMKG